MNFERLQIPYAMRQQAIGLGVLSMRRWVAETADGDFVRVMAAIEPFRGDNLPGAWHLSVSVASSPAKDQKPARKPTDSECAAALLLVPVRFEEESEGMVRHFWEVN